MTDDFKKYQQTNCRYCEATLSEPVLNLGIMPLANSYVQKEFKDADEFQCPLSLTVCPNCFLVQLTHVVPPEKMFSHYLYVSSTTKTFQDHFRNYAKDLGERLANKTGAVAVDIGSNDGLLVAAYNAEGMRGVGVDPATNLADEANRKGRVTINKFFDESCVDEIKNRFGEADIISGNNVFAHIHDVTSVCQNAKKLLKKDGILVFEFPYLSVMLEKLLFDMIYHEHLSYIGINPLKHFLEKFQMHPFDALLVPAHGGSLRIFIQNDGGPYPVTDAVGQFIDDEKKKGYLSLEAYHKFSDQVLLIKNDFYELIKDLKKSGKTISGYGAPAKASTITNFYGLDTAMIDFVVDDNPLKQNYLMPGSKIPIVPSDFLFEKPTDYVIIFAWNFAEEILKKIGFLQESGVTFLLPIPVSTVPQGNGKVRNFFEISACVK